MAWNANGVTQRRRLLDQSQTVAWGGSSTRVPTQAFRQTGFLARLRLKIPVQAGTLTVGGGVSVAAQAVLQQPASRMIQAFDIMAQGIAPLYQLGKGQDIKILEYMNNGRPRYQDIGLGALPDISPGSPLGTLGRISASLAAIGYHVAAASVSTTFQNVQVSGLWDIPLTEFVLFPEHIVQGQNGPVTVPAQEVEVGLVTLQNTQQNVTPHLTLNPLFSATVDSPFLQAGGTPTGTVSTLVEFYTEFYDVPSSPADQPPAYSQLFIVQRITTDDGVGGGQVAHTFTPAGLLLRAAYTFYDASDNLVDISAQGIQTIATYPLPAQTAEGVISFAWGSTVYKYTERFSMNLGTAFETYGEPPPPGCLFHDFFRDHSVTHVVNTAALASVRAIITGLPGNVTNLHTIEQRMIPVKVG